VRNARQGHDAVPPSRRGRLSFFQTSVVLRPKFGCRGFFFLRADPDMDRNTMAAIQIRCSLSTCRQSGRSWRCVVPLAATILLSGCGTNVLYILSEESRVLAKADPLVQSAEELANGLENPVYAAEEFKDRACDFLHEAVLDRLQRNPGFGEQFVSDLTSAVVLLVPIPQVERCAEALEAYSGTVDALSREIDSSATKDLAGIDSDID
jgi:hypothetical protein